MKAKTIINQGLYAVVATTLVLNAQAQDAISSFNNKLGSVFEQKSEDTEGRQVIISVTEATAASAMAVGFINARESAGARSLAKEIKDLRNTKTKEMILNEMTEIKNSSGSYDVTVDTYEGPRTFSSSTLTRDALAQIEEINSEARSKSAGLKIGTPAHTELMNTMNKRIQDIENNPKSWRNAGEGVARKFTVTGRQLSKRAVQRLEALAKQQATAMTNAEKASKLRLKKAALRTLEGNIAKRLGKKAFRFVVTASGILILADVGVRGYVFYVLDQDPGTLPLLDAGSLACDELNCESTVNKILESVEDLSL